MTQLDEMLGGYHEANELRAENGRLRAALASIKTETIAIDRHWSERLDRIFDMAREALANSGEAQ